MGNVSCRSCQGRGRKWLDRPGKWVECRACKGTGNNPNLWSTRCQRCRTEIIYKAYGTEPKYCKDCRNIQLEKYCGQLGCHNVIRYNVSWTDVPTYCKRCETKRSQGWSASTCPGTAMLGCDKLIWSPPGKKFNLCPDCSARKKAADEAKWRTKSCKGCGAEIRYSKDWDKVPDYCKSCNEWHTKNCASCNNQIKFKKYWDNIPNYCPDCKKGKKGHITAGDIYRSELVPRGWNHAGKVDIVDGHATMYFPGKGTNGGGYHVSWDGSGDPHWTDDGLPKGHPDRHRDPRK